MPSLIYDQVNSADHGILNFLDANEILNHFITPLFHYSIILLDFWMVGIVDQKRDELCGLTTVYFGLVGDNLYLFGLSWVVLSVFWAFGGGCG